MREMLLMHAERYPKMKVTDAVKLLYQSEFGGGHMIADPAKSLAWIRAEWGQMQTVQEVSGTETTGTVACMLSEVVLPNTESMEGEKGFASVEMMEKSVLAETGCRNIHAKENVLEDIGGGLCRLDLQALNEGLSPETLNRMFVKTADRTVGTVESFEKKLDVLRSLCVEGKMPFALEELENYLEAYQKDGYPPVSHSEIYREHYHPSYRVVSTSYTRYYPVFLAIDRALSSSGDKQVLVAIDGMCGSGKSTLGRILEEIYDCNLFHMDDFFLRPEQRKPERFAEPGGNVDYERFKEEVLEHISDAEGFSYQIYDCSCQKLTKEVKVPYKRLNIIEGAYSLHPYFENPYHLRFFCKIDQQEQLNRILKRNGSEMLERFKNTWIPMEMRYFEAFGVEQGCISVDIK